MHILKGLENGLDVNAVDKELMAQRFRLKTGKTRRSLLNADSKVVIAVDGLNLKDIRPHASHNSRMSVQMMGDTV
jgi:hypothetical protein